MKTLIVRRIDRLRGCEHSQLHHIRFPTYEDKGWYRMHISYAAFFEGIKERYQNEEFLYYLDDERDKKHRPAHHVAYEEERDALLPVFEHETLYDFFDAIGYDRKKKRIL